MVPKALQFLRENILSSGDLFGIDRSRWAEGLGLEPEGEVLFFAGCGYQYLKGASRFLSLAQRAEERGIDWEATWGLWGRLRALGRLFTSGQGRNPLRDGVELLRRAGLKVAYLGPEEPCCGAPLYFAGFRGDFSARIPSVIEALKGSGAKEVVGMVPSCTYALKELMGEVPFQVVPFPAYLARVDGGKRRLPQPKKVVYHDPCMLARYLGVTEEPRELLRSVEGVELLEPETSREWATCCGGGGGFEAVFPQVSAALARRRVEELLRTGAEVIVTACPGCLLQLSEGVKAVGAKGVEVLDLAEFLARAEG